MLLTGIRFYRAILLAALYSRHGLLSSDAAAGADGLGPVFMGGSTVQGGLYSLFGSIGAVIDVAAVIALALLAYFVREHGRPGFRLALAAAICSRCSRSVVGARLPGQCRAREMGERSRPC
jgi:hypothetical protein